ncbi:MAG: LysM peptidoglycan-binding domain-containing protein [Pseudomonadales bacterium]|nr:LysM peptidoglycan-binding domain-containing protein [Pseudomonadales bacterium]
MIALYFPSRARSVFRALGRFKFLLASAFMCTALSVPAQAADWQYTVRPGDTVWSVCEKYTSYADCWRELPALNAIANPRSISVGQRLSVPASWLKTAPIAASVVFVHGDVELVEGDSTRALKTNQQLAIGARVTSRQGSATLQFVDGSLLTMTAFSEITLDSVSAFKQSRSTSIRVSVPRGEVGVRVPLRAPRTNFEIRTPSAVAAVRGTRFRVTSDASTELTRSEVLEGQVGLSAEGASQLLDTGFGSLARRGQAPIDPVQLLDPPPWNLSCNDPGYAEWFAPPGAQAYKLVLLEDNLQSDRVLQSVAVKDTNYTFRNLETGCYQLRVNAVDMQGFNGLESQRQFCYDLQLAAPAIEELRWRSERFATQWGAVQYAESYEVEVARDPAFSDLVASFPVTATQLNAELEAMPGNVYVRVRALARDGQVAGDFSESLFVEHSKPRHWLAGIASGLLAFLVL